MSAADLVSRYFDYAVFGMEFAVCVFVGLRYAGYVFDYPEALDEVDIDFACISDQSENRLVFAFAFMNVYPEDASHATRFSSCFSSAFFSEVLSFRVILSFGKNTKIPQ